MKYIRKQKIEDNLFEGRVLVIYGPRRVGKTTLLKEFLETQKNKKVYFSTGDDIIIRELFASENRVKILDFASPHDVIAIDEAQNIKKIGLGVKMIIDSFPEKNIILTGSSAFELSREVGEPLTGRHFTMTLLPFSEEELGLGKFELENKLDEYLIYGKYPEVLKAHDTYTKEKILQELISSYLLKDILALDNIKSPDLLLDIVRCLAFQVGGEVSFNEIARIVKSDVKTIQRYVDVLEKMFVIKKVRGYSKNLRNEISKKTKFYFYDNGIRNAVISQFNNLSTRDDIGGLWENYIFMELYKKSVNGLNHDTYYFWRTHTGQEIDIIKETNGSIVAFECKWSKETAKVPPLFSVNYPTAEFSVIHKNNYLEYLITK